MSRFGNALIQDPIVHCLRPNEPMAASFEKRPTGKAAMPVRLGWRHRAGLQIY